MAGTGPAPNAAQGGIFDYMWDSAVGAVDMIGSSLSKYVTVLLKVYCMKSIPGSVSPSRLVAFAM
jgi:hypothetical protein